MNGDDDNDHDKVAQIEEKAHVKKEPANERQDKTKREKTRK